MLSKIRQMAALAMLPALLLASGCATVKAEPIFPRLADLEAVTVKKPVPTPDIVDDAQAEARYNADVETWGDGMYKAGVRLCVWFKGQGMKVKCD